MINLNFQKPSLKNEEAIVRKYINSKNIKYLINIENSFSLKKESTSKIVNFIQNQLTKKKEKIEILIISNLSYQIFNRSFVEKLLLKEINSVISYFDYNTFLNLKNTILKKYNFIFFLPDTSDLLDISQGGNSTYFNKENFNQTKSFYNLLIEKISKQNAKVFIGKLVNYEKLDFGTYTKKLRNLKDDFIDKLNQYLLKIISDKNFYLFDNEIITYKFGVNRFRNSSKFLFARVPFTSDYSDYFFSILANLISIALGNIKKLLILDLDNTLWGGILGDDGPNGVIIGNDSPLGRAFLDFQRSILNLHKRGVLLAICSKNDLQNVKNIFKKNDNLILKMSHFVSVKANWQNKAQNIKEISNELNLGTDSFVFFDDNPVERDLVRSHHPEIAIPEIDEDPSLYSTILLDNYYFDLVNFSKEDLNRSKTYTQNAKREKLKSKYYDINSYLQSLNMTCEVKEFQPENFDRIVQLFQRSNQFNFTTIRYSLSDVKEITKNNKKTSFQFLLRDKFSNYGIISLIVCSITKDVLELSNWVMSCRVLNRTLEIFVLNKLVKFCKKNKINFIKSKFIKTKKNSLVQNKYEELGFKIEKKKKFTKEYIISVDNYEYKKNFIKEI